MLVVLLHDTNIITISYYCSMMQVVLLLQASGISTYYSGINSC